MGALDRTQVPIICPECGHTARRWPEQLRRELRPRCTFCGGNVTAEVQKMLQAIEAAERVLADDRIAKIPRGKSLEPKHPG
jgi:transposase-like protein